MGEPEEGHVGRELAAQQQRVDRRGSEVAEIGDLGGLGPKALARDVGAAQVDGHVIDDVA